jgi:hypothetical protein
MQITTIGLENFERWPHLAGTLARSHSNVRHGRAWLGIAWFGMAWQAWVGQARIVMPWSGRRARGGFEAPFILP